MAIQLFERPLLRFAVREDGALERLSPWFPVLFLPAGFLDGVDGRRLSVEGDVLTFRCVNGWARYRLSAPNGDGERAARLLEAA